MAFDFPSSPTLGQQVTTPNGSVYQWDGTKWVSLAQPNNYAPILSPTFTGDPKAPTPSPGDNDTSLATTAFVTAAVTAAAPSLLNLGRNFIRNAMMRVNQRGNGPFTTQGYGIDGWYLLPIGGDTASVTIAGLSDAERAQIGDEEFQVCAQNVFVGNAAAGAFGVLYQSIEDVRRLSNHTVTVSFWAKAAAGTPKLGVSIDQYFGTGGAPSATTVVNGTSVTLSTTWARYSVTLAVPSAAGKTTGTNQNSATNILFWYSSGATNLVRSGNVGVQSGTISITGVQCEIGASASIFEKIDSFRDTLMCMRYFQSTVFSTNGYAAAGVGIGAQTPWHTPFRATPVTATNGVGLTNCAGSIVNVSFLGFVPYATASATGGLAYAGNITASAEL